MKRLRVVRRLRSVSGVTLGLIEESRLSACVPLNLSSNAGVPQCADTHRRVCGRLGRLAIEAEASNLPSALLVLLNKSVPLVINLLLLIHLISPHDVTI